MLRALAAGRRATRSPRAEFTCEWLDRPLVDFARSRDRVLTITAEAGAGKSYLFGWILERFQRRIGHHEYQAIQASVDSQVPAQATQIALVKSLLLQLLEQNVGNVTLFRCLANVTQLSENTSSTEDAEDALWFTLDAALQGLENVVLVIDGLDSLEGDEAAKLRAFEHLYDIATKNRHNVRVIILTRPLSKPWPKPTRQVAMTAQRTTVDVKHMVRAWLIRRGLGTKQEVEDISEQIAQRSKGSLTWADMSLQLLSKATTVAEVTTAVKELPATTSELLAKQISTISLKGEARLIISWLLASKRPLSTVEIQALLELDTEKGTHQPRSTDIVEDIKKSCGTLVIVQDKTVRFRNETIRLHLLELSKKETTLFSPAEANRDLTARLLLYVKTCVTRNVESSLDKINSREVDSLFKTHALLEYATRNWLAHFKNSSFYTNGQIQTDLVTGQLKGVFPNSTLLARLEQRCWDKQTLASSANSSHVLALTVRQQALGDNAQSVLQSCINVAQSFKKISAPAEASKYFYKAAKIGQNVLGRASDLAVSCATASLDISASIKDKATARNEAVTEREELLKYVIDAEKQRTGGNNSALASKYTNELAELYTSIKENDKAEAVYHEVYKTSVAQNGQFSAEATKAAEKLQTVLYKEAKHEQVVSYQKPLFESAQRTLDIFDIRRVEITLRMADTYEQKKDYTHAEELYISLWRGLTEYCRSSATSTATAATISEAHERKIQISLAYARFLRRQGRDAEAQNILHGVWLDYQQMTDKSEVIVKQLNEVGEELKSMGILDAAIAVFKSVWGYFKGSGKQTSAAAVSTAVSLMGAVQEKTEKKQAEAAKVKAAVAAKGGVQLDASFDADVDAEEDELDDEEADAILDEVVKAAVAAPAAAAAGKTETKTKEVEVVTIESQIQTCETLSSFYVSKRKWPECVEVCSQLLKQLWPELGTSAKYGFPKAHRDETIKFTRRLALAYTESNQTEQAEKLYTAIFEASLRSGLKVQDELVTESANQLVEFHKKTQQWSKVLAVYQQLLLGYKTSLGSRNPLTIKTLYIMGDLCVQYRIKGYNADTYYLELVKADKSSTGVISKDTLPAALALSKIYYEQKRWTEVRSVYASLWTAFTKCAKEYNMSTELVQTIYKRYTTVLDTHLKVNIEEVRKIAVEYRDTCTQVYGASSDITMSASMALVAVSRKCTDVQHQQEAVKICEEVVAQAEKQKAAEGGKEGGKAVDAKKSAFQLSLLASAKRHLASLYTMEAQASASAATGAGAGAGGAAKAVVSAESTKKAEALWQEQLEVNKKTHGCAHKATLASLASLVSVWARSDKAEVRKQAQEKLDTSVVEVLSESCVAGTATVDSTKLHESGVSLAKTYLSCGFSAQAWALLKQLRFHVVARGKIAGSATTLENTSTLKLTENVDRRSLVFLASFEETLRTSEAETAKLSSGQKIVKVTFSDIMTDLLTEGILYDRYSLTIASKELSVEQKLFDGARLYVFLKINKEQHAEQLVAVEESLYKLFMEKFGAAIKTEARVTRAFLLTIIEELGKQSIHEDNLIYITCSAVTARVYALLLVDSYAQAVDMATAWYQFMVSQNGFKNSQTIAFAFKLSLYLAGLGVKSTKAADAIMLGRMLELSKTILRETLAACKTMNIDLISLQASELNSLVRLMGQQKNYEDLEWLLTQLWNSRIIQASWSATTVIAVGRRLVEVLFLRGKRDAAISLAESMAYNLRRTWGLLDAATVDINNLLSSLCVADQRYADALDVHEEILRALLDLNLSSQDDDADDAASELMDFDEENAAALALQQLELVRRVYARNAGWPESEDLDMAQLTSDVVAEFAPMAPDAYAPFGNGDSAQWSKTAPSANDTMGTFIAPSVWEFSLAEEAQPGKPALAKRPSHMLRSLQLSRQRSYGDLSEARKMLGNGSDAKSAVRTGNALLTTPVH